MKFKLIIAASALAAALSAAPLDAQQRAPAPDAEEAERLAREGAELLFRALELLLERIPQYEPPIINENGDIIIRRRNPPPRPAPPAEPEGPTETRT